MDEFNQEMHSALVVAVGSRGDVEPLFAAAISMLASTSFDRIHICLQPEYANLVPPDTRIRIHTLSFGVSSFATVFYREYFKNCVLSLITRDLDHTRCSRRFLSTIIKRFVVPELPHLHGIARRAQPSMMLATTLAGPAVAGIAEQLGIPMWLVNFQPNTPTSCYPYYMSGAATASLAGKEVAQMQQQSPRSHENKQYASSYKSHQGIHKESLRGINAFRACIGLSSLDMADVHALFCGRMQNVRILNAFSEHLVARSPDWSSGVYQVPALAQDYIPPNWKPEEKCPQLARYLASGEPPLCVTFGSMTVTGKKAKVTRELFLALRAVGIKRVLLLKGQADLGTHHLSSRDSNLRSWADEHVFISDEACQYAWLLPKCSALVCHGGAGSMFAGLRAGIPVVIAPLLCDQFFWGQLISDLGLGAVARPTLREANADAFERAIRVALSDATLERVARYSQVERMSGGTAATDIFSSLLSRGSSKKPKEDAINRP